LVIEIQFNKLALPRGHFLKKFRKCPLCALWENSQNKKEKDDDTMNNDKKKVNMNKFVRYAEGAKIYGMGLSKFQQLAKDAKACYKVGQLVLVNTEIIDEYLELFHIVDDEFYK
jgi:hypothetical protein